VYLYEAKGYGGDFLRSWNDTPTKNAALYDVNRINVTSLYAVSGVYIQPRGAIILVEWHFGARRHAYFWVNMFGICVTAK
jgi:hypothetical protein